MKSKNTVIYICEDYIVSGVQFYWKRELLTLDSHRNPGSSYWSRRKPITAQTFRKAQRDGYPCEVVTVTHPPGVVILLSDNVKSGTPRKGRRRRDRRKPGEALRKLLSR